MSTNITVKMKDGTTRNFLVQKRPGGSWRESIKFEGAFVVITDEWNCLTAIPAADIVEVVEVPC